MGPADAPNLNYAWCGLLVEEFIRQGVAGFVISPGSRNAPLTVSVARNKRARYWMHYDERGAGFFALGLAKATGKPAVLICTSGSAAANYWPAVVEASADLIPLIVLTADRPPELLDCGANQAIDQTHLYGRYARWYTALPCPTPACDAAFVLTTADQAWHRSQHPLAGPVHINVALRDPLDPSRDKSVTPETFESLADWVDSGTPYTHYNTAARSMPNEAAAQLLHDIQCADNGLLIVGRLDRPSDADAVREVAIALGWRVYADCTTGLHGPGAPPNLLADVDNAVMDAAMARVDASNQRIERQLLSFRTRGTNPDRLDARALNAPEDERVWPDFVLHLGGGYTAKSLLNYLKRTPVRYVHVCDTDQRLDPNHQVSQHVSMPVDGFCRWLSGALGNRPAPEVAPREDDAFPTVGLSEPAIARLLGGLVPADSLLFAGNSMPIRLVERFCRPKQPGVRIVANRGASGIDGNIATALGMAAAGTGATTMLIGDLTALHDLNSLALIKHAGASVVLIVINNDGGGIFHYLPIAYADEPCFEACFGTPHGLNFAGAAQMFGVAYERPESPTDFTAAYQRALEAGGATLIEVTTDRYESRHPHHGQSSPLPTGLGSPSDTLSVPSALAPVPLAGSPDKPPLLLLHGFMGNAHDWDTLAPHLGESHYVLGVNLPGHGPGWDDVFIEVYDIATCARELNGHLDHLGIATCSLLGYSMGGRFALYLATHFPKRFTRVVLESASPGLDSEAQRQARQVQDMALAERLEPMEPGSAEYRRFLEDWYAQPLFDSLQSRHDLLEGLIASRLAQNSPRLLSRSIPALGTGAQPDLWPALSDYHTPTLLLVGEDDRKFRIIAEDMCAACPAIAMEAFSGCGHNTHLENPSGFITAVRAFLKPAGTT